MHEKINIKIKVLPKHVPPTSLELSTVPHPTFIQQPPPSYVLKTVNPNVYINSFSCPSDKLITEILNLLRPHVEHSPKTDPFVILNHIFDNYQNL